MVKMDKEKSLKIIEQFKDKKILVLGDVMLDKYIWGGTTIVQRGAADRFLSGWLLQHQRPGCGLAYRMH